MTVFLFTDVEGSTELWQKYPAQMGDVLARHDALLHQAIAAHGGVIVKNTGDGVFAVFEAGEPLAGALAIQQGMATLDVDQMDKPQVRVAIHVGQADQRGGDYFGLDVNRTARLLAAGWGGQILLTCEMARLGPPPPGAQLLDLGIHILKDLSEPQHIFQLSHPELARCEFPALRTLSAHPHNLPPQPTPFIGRMSELAEITSRLTTTDCRLLTLFGPGGIGKTRLALQAAAEMIDAFPNGVYFVPLAPLETSAQMVPAIAEALKLTFYSSEAPKTLLLNYLREKALLFVLDNFEHISDGAPLAAEVLATAAKVKILVTSRERLNLREEQVFNVEGLRLPEIKAYEGTTAVQNTAAVQSTAQDDVKISSQEPGSYGQEIDPSSLELGSFSSVKLFVQSARRTRPDFELTHQEGPCVARICRLVEGIPLCIELAAGWLRALSCQEIAAELETNLDFLETNLRDVPERHRSLRAVFDYSWSLLTEREKLVLSRLAVFQGAFSRPAAEAVTEIKKHELLLALTGLVDKSLLKRNAYSANNMSGDYELHSVMRQYALERLEATPDIYLQTRTRHAAYFTAYIAEHQPALRGPHPKTALEETAAAFDDIRAAWLWALSQENFKPIAAAHRALFFFLNLRDHRIEGKYLFGEAAAIVEKALPPDPGLLLRLRIRYAIFCHELHLYTEAEELLTACLASARQEPEQAGFTPDAAEAALAAMWLGNIANLHGDYPKANAFYTSSLETYQALGEPRSVSRAINHLGVVAWTLGDHARAQEYFVQALDLARQHGSPLDIAQCLDHMGVTYRDQERHDEARQCFAESVEILEPLDAKHNLAYCYNHLAGSALQMEENAVAIDYFEKSNALAHEMGDRRLLAYNYLDMSQLYHNLPDGLKPACDLLRKSADLFNALGESFGYLLAQSQLARVIYNLGEHHNAWRMAAESIKAAIQLQNSRVTTQVLELCGFLFAEKGQWQRAVAILTSVPEDLAAAYQVSESLQEIGQHLSAEDYRLAQEQGKQLNPQEILHWMEIESGEKYEQQQ